MLLSCGQCFPHSMVSFHKTPQPQSPATFKTVDNDNAVINITGGKLKSPFTENKVKRSALFLSVFFFFLVVAKCNASCYWLQVVTLKPIVALLLFFYPDRRLVLS